MNKTNFIKAATITVPMLTLGILAGSVASAATSNATSPNVEKRVMFFRHGDMKGMKLGKMDETRMQKHKDVAAAVENNDYAKFKELTADAPFADKVNETSFAKLVEAHKLMKQAQTLMEESGLRMPMGQPGMGMKVFNAPVEPPVDAR